MVLYQSSVSNPVVFTPQIMNQVQITVANQALGASNDITVKYTTSVAYDGTNVLYIRTPGSFGRPANPMCILTIGTGAAGTPTSCPLENGDIKFSLGNGALVPGTAISVVVQAMTNPLCLQTNYQFELLTQSGAFDMEKATSTFSTMGFALAPFSISSITQTATFSASLDDIVITASASSTIVTGSYLKVILPATYVIAASTTIDLTGTQWGGASPTANKLSATEFTITDGVLANRNPADNIVIKIQSMFNPRGLGSFPVIVEVYSSDGCKYMSASKSIINDKIQMIQNAVMTIPASFRNTYQVYNFTVTPSSNSLSTGDMISIELPTGLLLSNNPLCKAHSANIVSLSCRRVSNTIIAMTPTIDAAAYALNKQLSFSVDKIRNPDSQGAVAGFFFRVTDNSGTVYENYPSVSYTFSDYISPNMSQAVFLGRRVGEVSTTNLTIMVDTFLAEKSRIILTFSDNFDLSQLITINSSSVLINSSSVNTTSRQLVIELVAAVPANTTMNLSLNMPNPSVQRVQASDISVKIETFDGLQIFSISAIRSDTPEFLCTSFCTGCRGSFSTCTTCEAGYKLSEAKICQLDSVQAEYFPNYIFIGTGLGLTLLMLFVGLICNCRNYWGNLLYSVLKINFFGFCILWGFTWMKNDVEYNMRIASYGLAGAHFVLTWIFFGVIRAASNRSKYQERFHKPEQTSLEMSELNDEEMYHNELGLDSAFRYMFNSFMVFSLIFSTAIVRWFFSEKGKRKGYFWYFEPKAFVNIRDALECYQILYFVLFILPFAGLNIYYIYGKPFSDWNKYMFEGLLLCILDLLIYLVAYCELANSKRKILEMNKYAITGEPIPAKEPAKEGDQSFSKDKSAVLDETRKDEKSVLLDPNEKTKGDDKLSSPLLDPSKSPTNAMSGTVITAAPMITHKGPMDDTEKTLKGANKDPSNEKVTLNQSELPSMMFQPRRSVISVARTQGEGSKLDESTSKLDRSALRPLIIHPQGTSIINSEVKKEPVAVHPFSLQPSAGKLRPVENDPSYPSYPSSSNMMMPEPSKPVLSRYPEPQTTSTKQLRGPSESLANPKPPMSPTSDKYSTIPSTGNKVLGEANTSPRFVPDKDSSDHVLQYPSTKIGDQLTNSTVKPPSKSRFRENQRKRVKNSSWRRPLEVIYEEAETDTPLLTDWNNPSASKLADQSRLKDSKKDLRGSVKTEEVIRNDNLLNGQKVSDLKQGRLLDRNNRPLELRAQDPEDLKEGIFRDGEGRTIPMNTQDDDLLKRGLIKDIDGGVFRVKDQDLDELQHGIYLRPDGTVENVNGQKPLDVDNQELYDRAGNKIDLKTQDPNCYKRSTFKVENNPKPLVLESPQLQDKFEIGIITAPDGRDYRLKDQYFDEIQNRGVYRNRNLSKLDFGLPKEEPKAKYVPKDWKDDGVESTNNLRPKEIGIKDYAVVAPLAGVTPESTSRPYLKRQNTSRTEGNPAPTKYQPARAVANDPRPYSALGIEDKPIVVRKPFIQKSEKEFSGIDDDETPHQAGRNAPLASLPNFSSQQPLTSVMAPKKSMVSPSVATREKPQRSAQPHLPKEEDTFDDARPVEKKPNVSVRKNERSPDIVDWGKSDSDGKMELEEVGSKDRTAPRVSEGYARKQPAKVVPTPKADFEGVDDDSRPAPYTNKPQAKPAVVQSKAPVSEPKKVHQEHPKPIVADTSQPKPRNPQTKEPQEIPVKEVSSPTQKQDASRPAQLTKASQPPHSRPAHHPIMQSKLPQSHPSANEPKSKQQSSPQQLPRFDPFQQKQPVYVTEQELLLDRTPLWPSAQGLYKSTERPPLSPQQQPPQPRSRVASQQLPQRGQRQMERAVDDELESNKGSQDSRTMYLDLMMDESLEIDVNIEEVDDDRESVGSKVNSRGSHNRTHPDSQFIPKTRLAKIAHSNLGQEDGRQQFDPVRPRVPSKDIHFREERLSRNSGDDVVGRNALRRKQHPDY